MNSAESRAAAALRAEPDDVAFSHALKLIHTTGAKVERYVVRTDLAAEVDLPPELFKISAPFLFVDIVGSRTDLMFAGLGIALERKMPIGESLQHDGPLN